MKLRATPQETAAVRRMVERSPSVRTYEFLSHEDAFREFQRLFADDPDLIVTTTPDQLPTSFRVTLVDSGKLGSFKRAVRDLPGVDEVKSFDSFEPDKLARELERVCRWREQHPGEGDVEVFLRLDVSAPQTNEVQVWLERSPFVRSFDFVSHTEALRRFRKQFSDKPKLIESMTADQLPTSFRVQLTEGVPGSPVHDLTQLPGVDDVVERPTAAVCYALHGPSA